MRTTIHMFLSKWIADLHRVLNLNSCNFICCQTLSLLKMWYFIFWPRKGFRNAINLLKCPYQPTNSFFVRCPQQIKIVLWYRRFVRNAKTSIKYSFLAFWIFYLKFVLIAIFRNFSMSFKLIRKNSQTYKQRLFYWIIVWNVSYWERFTHFQPGMKTAIRHWNFHTIATEHFNFTAFLLCEVRLSKSGNYFRPWDVPRKPAALWVLKTLLG